MLGHFTTLMADHTAGRFPPDTILVIITHGLALRIFLMRWLHWTVDQASLHIFCDRLAATASTCHSDGVHSHLHILLADAGRLEPDSLHGKTAYNVCQSSAAERT